MITLEKILYFVLFFIITNYCLSFVAGFIRGLIQSYEEFKKNECDCNEILVRIEKYNDQFLLYNSDTNEFLAQGKTRKDIETVLRQRFPNNSFSASNTNMKETKFDYESI
jgi:hypothetical protein